MIEKQVSRKKYPLLSVIIPVYNAMPYLKKCLDSVVKQTYKNLEILLVDDGSTDESPALCDAYAKTDDRIKVIHKENEGLVRARKTGVSIAAGEYITYVDADDWIDTDAYERILSSSLKNNADLILYGLAEEYEDASVEKENLFEEGYYAKKEIAEKLYPAMLCNDVFFQFGIIPNLFCKLVRREILTKVQKMVSDSVTFGEDVDCTFQMLLEAASVQIVNCAPYHYRKRHDSMVWENTVFSRIQSLYRDLKEAFEKNVQREMLMPQLYKYMLFILLLKSADRFVDCETFQKCFENKKIVLYGAGGFGQAVYRVLTEQNMCEIVLWADQKYKLYRELDLPVSVPEKIADCGYDSIFIAVLDRQVCERIAENLVAQGVCAEKICYIAPTADLLERTRQILEE